MNKKEYAIKLGDNFKKYRLSHGYTQKQFAEMAGVTILTYMKYEKGRVAVPALVVAKITGRVGGLADVLNILPKNKI